MYKKNFILSLLVLIISTGANAAQGSCTSTVRIISDSSQYSQANFVQFLNPGACPGACTDAVSYIDYADKDLYAMVLSAAIMNRPIGVAWETAAPRKTSGTHAINITCKVKSAWYPG